MFQSSKNPVLDEIVQVAESATKAEQKRMLHLLKAEIAHSRESNQKKKRRLPETKYLLKSSANRRSILKNLKSRRKKVFQGDELSAFVKERMGK